jgi:hypothetical protein
MARRRENGAFRGLAIYGLLLELYPHAYLRRHREELLQNFQDLEQELPSKTALRCFIAKDLAVSLRSEFTRTLWGQATIVFTVLGLMLAIAHRYPGPREHSIWSFCFGYALGWFAGRFGWRWRMSSVSPLPSFVRSFRGQAAMLVGAISIVLAAATLFPDLHERLVLASCYGAVLAWIAAWRGNYRRMCL